MELAEALPAVDQRHRPPLKHGYINRALTDGALVEKTHEGCRPIRPLPLSQVKVHAPTCV